MYRGLHLWGKGNVISTATTSDWKWLLVGIGFKADEQMGNHEVPLIWQSNLCSTESSRTVNSQGVGSCCPFQLPLTQTIDTKSHFLERFCWLRPPSLKSYKVLAQTCRRRWRREIVGMKHWFISSRFRWIWNSYENSIKMVRICIYIYTLYTVFIYYIYHIYIYM